MSVATAIFLLEQVSQDIDEGRLTSVGDVKIAVNIVKSMLNNTEELAEDEDQFKILLELESLNERRAKCEARLAKFQERAQQQRAANSATTAEGSTNATQPTAESAKPDDSIPSTSFRPSAITSDLRFAMVAFPGGPRTVTIHPPDSPQFQSIIRDEIGDIIIIFETPQDSKKGKPLRREGAFYGLRNYKRGTRADANVRSGGKRQDADSVPPVPSHSDTQSQRPYTGQPRVPTTDAPTAESRRANRSTNNEHLEAPAASRSTHVAPTRQKTGRPLKRCGAKRDVTLPSPPPGEGKGKERAREEGDDEDEDEDAKEAEELLTFLTPTSPRTAGRAEETKPSPPPVRRSKRLRVVNSKYKEPTTNAVKHAEPSHAVEKPGPAKRRRLR